ncbi:MAG TPA: choice-of-anchor tandem repeat GloVer-containing protein [Rhizomicrobium sp.]|nr:choice-of-anchor tandem repeat GloVer-containing protein [Rhizomicrobium sp.]
MTMRAAAAVFAAALAVTASSAYAGTFRVLHVFCAKGGTCADGEAANDLVMDRAGNLYGTTNAGGANTWGTVFQLSPGGGGKWTYRVLHSFCHVFTCTDGGAPAAPPIIDANGNLYGTASASGAHGNGVVYEMVQNPTTKTWKEKVLYAFCAKTNCADGSNPQTALTYAGAASGAPYDGTSPLYGTVTTGSANGTFKGAVYELSPGKGGKWSEQVLYSFCAQDHCSDGATPTPYGALALDTSGNLYGTTQYGGAANEGVAFELSPQGSAWSESVLHDFCAANDCHDGGPPYANMIIAPNGSLIGTTPFGGQNLQGTIYTLVPGAVPLYSVIYDFCSLALCADGSYPYSHVTLDPSGNMYGTAEQHGRTDDGIVFELNGGLHVLHNFCTKSGCPDGQFPQGALVRDGSGNLFGTTQEGGTHEHGVIFEIAR